MTDATELDTAGIRARLEAATECWSWHEDTDDTLAGWGAHMGQMLDRLPHDRQTDDMRDSILAMVTDVDRLLTALDEARAEAGRLREVERHRDLLLNGFFASCPENHEHGVWCGSAWVALTNRAEAAEAKVEQWRERMWATVSERAVWRHDLGEHSGDLPFMPCPSCERDVHAARAEAAEAKVAAVKALADEIHAEARRHCADGADVYETTTLDRVARRLTAALDAPTDGSEHRCDTCTDCLHDGAKCCGCHDGVCCKETQP